MARWDRKGLLNSVREGFDYGRLYWHLEIIGASKTKAREEVFRHLYLSYQEGPQTVEQVVIATGKLLHKASVYRCLKPFAEAGIAQEVEPGRYELTDRFKQHHHYQRCRICGRRVAFRNEKLEKIIDGMSDPSGKSFVIEDHNMELVGLCWECVKDPDTKPRRAIGTLLRRPPGF